MSSLALVFITVLTKTIVLIMFTTLLFFVKLTPGLTNLIIFIAIGSLIISTAFLFYTESVREFIAYTSLASNGFLLLVLAYITEFSGIIGLFYIIVQAFNLLFLFFVFSFFKTKGLFPKTFWQFRNYVEINLLFFVFFCLVIFSLLGIPPFAGFFPKIMMMYYLYSIKAYGVLLCFMVFTLGSSLYFVRLLQFFSGNNVKKGVLFLTRKFKKMYMVIVGYILFTLLIIFVMFTLFTL
jgi:NADH:ubiquinone oxidoreductase subunit 2 (subunit N)